MADVKLSDLTTISTVGATDLLYIVDENGSSFSSRKVSISTINAALDHGTLTGLLDDDHTQYARLAGRSGGQILSGGTGSGEELSIQSTTNSTKGSVFVGNFVQIIEASKRIDIRATVPSGHSVFTINAASGTITLTDSSTSDVQFQATTGGIFAKRTATIGVTGDGAATNATITMFTGSTTSSNASDRVSLYVTNFAAGDARLHVISEIGSTPVILGNGEVRSPQFVSTIATGTAPLTITSTTVVPNLNADKHDGLDTADMMRGYLRGLGMSNNGTDPDHDIDIAAGAAWDNVNSDLLKLSSVITKRLDAGWAVGNNQGGLDTGSIAVTTEYFVFLIKRPDTGVVDVLFSTSRNSPTMPANYTLKRYIGFIMTDISANIEQFIQTGDIFELKSPKQMFNDSTLGTTRKDYPLDLPSGEAIFFEASLFMSHASAGVTIYISNPNLDNVAPTTTSPIAASMRNEVASQGVASIMRLVTDEFNTISARSTNANTTFRGSLLRWFDRRGQDNYN